MSNDSAEFLLQRAQSLIELKRYQEAIAQLGLALAKEPEDTDSLYLMALCYLRLDDIDNAARINESSLRINANNVWALHLHSLIRHKQLHFDAELALAQQACVLEPEHPDMLQRLAEAQMQSGMKKAAKDTANTLVSLDPNSYAAHELMAEVSFNLQDWKQAEIHSREALRHSPDSNHLHHWLAESLQQQKRSLEAIEASYRAMINDPSSSHGQKRLYELINEYLGITSGAARKKRLEKLPEEARLYYEDKRNRTSWLEQNSTLVYVAGWLVVGGIIVVIIDSFS